MPNDKPTAAIQNTSPATLPSGSIAAQKFVSVSGFASALKIMKAHQEAMRTFSSTLAEAFRIQEQGLRPIFSTFAEVRRTQDEAIRNMLLPLKEIRAVQERFANISFGILNHQKQFAELSKAITQAYQPLFESQKRIALAFAQIGQFRASLEQLSSASDRLSRLHTVSDGGTLEDIADEVATIDSQRTEAEHIREFIFAFCNSDDLLPERQYVERELERQQGFGDYSVPEKIDTLLRIARANQEDQAQDWQSGKLMVYCVAVAIGLLADYLTQMPFVVKSLFIAFVLATDYLAPQQRKAHAGRLIRAACIPTADMRIVAHSCAVYSSTKRNAHKIDTLQQGTLVEVADKLGGLQEVHYYQGGGRRNGWVHSKYLRRI